MKYVALTLALLGAAGLYVGARVLQQDPAAQASGWEVRVFVLDKGTGNAVDLTDWTAELKVEPRGGKEQKVAMERVAPKGLFPRRDEKTPDRDGGKPADKKFEDKTFEQVKPEMKHVQCGQVKDMDRTMVELVVVNTGWTEKGLHKTGNVFPGDETDPKKVEKKDLHGNGWQQKGYLHDHGGYFKAVLPKTWWTDAKHNALGFDADVYFTYGTDKKSVKGFSYPFGLYKDVLQKVMDEDLKQARDYVRANDSAKWKEVGERVMGKTHALPELTFKKVEDKEEFERAKRECMAACQRICNATTKEQAAEAIDQCKDKCDDYQDEAQDAEGVNWDFRGYDTRTTEPKLPDTRK